MIYIKNYKRTKNETISSLIRTLFDCKDKEIKIISSIVNSIKTYHDKECTIIQCDSLRRRSFEDIVELCKTYFKNVTDKKIAVELDKLFKEYRLEEKYFKFLYCPHVAKWVIICSKKKEDKLRYCYDYQNCTSYPDKKNFQYSLNDIFDLMGYTTKESRLNFD